MTKELKRKWSEITMEYLQLNNAGRLEALPYDVKSLLWRMASEMQEAICADSRAKLKAHQTRVDNAYWRTR